jgi:hypothetical protein
MHYDPKLDRSEEFGWKKYSEEAQPTEQEQQFWGRVMIVFSLCLIVLAFVL